METEIQKLHEELSEAHQKELDEKIMKDVGKVRFHYINVYDKIEISDNTVSM